MHIVVLVLLSAAFAGSCVLIAFPRLIINRFQKPARRPAPRNLDRALKDTLGPYKTPPLTPVMEIRRDLVSKVGRGEIGQIAPAAQVEWTLPPGTAEVFPLEGPTQVEVLPLGAREEARLERLSTWWFQDDDRDEDTVPIRAKPAIDQGAAALQDKWGRPGSWIARTNALRSGKRS